MAIPKLLDLLRNSVSKEYVDNNGGTFEAKYGETTYEEITTAIGQGKQISLKYDSIYYYLVNVTDTVITFQQIDQGISAAVTRKLITLTSPNTWKKEADWTFMNMDYPIYLTTKTNASKNIPISADTRYYRPILVSTAEPKASDGQVGDIWIQYEE